MFFMLVFFLASFVFVMLVFVVLAELLFPLLVFAEVGVELVVSEQVKKTFDLRVEEITRAYSLPSNLSCVRATRTAPENPVLR